jgi:pyruvate/2-oxoglutarate/acetoin dehydrogenase E1 component
MAETTYVGAIHDALREEMARDERVFCLGEDIATLGGAFKVTAGLLDEFGPLRVVDTPIAESLIVGAAVGAALQGQRPVAEMQFMDFISCGFDQLVNMTATLRYRHGGQEGAKVPMVVRGPSGSGVTGALFHSQNPEAWFYRVPGLKIVCPATVYDAKGLMKAAIREDNPVFVVQHKRLGRIREDVPEGDYEVPIGKARVVREGSDITLVATSFMVHEALAAADRLKERGVEAEVVDPRTLVPLDIETIVESVKKTHRVVVAHEAVRFCGVGAEIASQITEQAFDYLDGPPLRVGAPSSPVPYSPALEREWVPGADEIVEAANTLVGD